ncbi:MAG: winged helix-turn-helix domain-containing protein [Actinomycetota bacterium]
MPGAPAEISRRRARQLAVMAQRLDAPRPRSIDEVLAALGEIQMDPTSVVARTEHLVLFSRLGRSFRVAQLERRMWTDRAMFEYWAHIVPMSDLPLHRISMRRYPHGHWKRHQYVRDWLAANDAFVRYALRELRRRGPLRTRDLENRAAEGWETGGWNDEGQNAAMLLDILWSQGKVMIVGRDGQQRLWDLASRWLPRVPARAPAAMAADLVERQLRARGIARLDRLGYLFDGALPGRDEAVARLLRRGVIVPVRVESYPGRWHTHRDLLDRSFRGRTVALSPFDDLISDRTRTERLFDMHYRIEIYVPKATRWGYFVLPVLRDDRLVGRIDPVWDRADRVLRINAWQMQPDTDAADRDAVREAIDELGRWLRAERVALPRTLR